MNRYAMIDGLRGIGALAIAVYHIFRYGELPIAAQSVVPDLIETCIFNGWMAVQWFFVIAGFATVQATRSWQSTIEQTATHVLRRTLRLGAAYWVALAITALLTVVAVEVCDDRSLNEATPTPGQFLAHVFFLQDILGYDCLSTGVWFIAIAMQLDLVFMALMLLATYVQRAMERYEIPGAPAWSLAICFGPLTVWSLFWSIGNPDTDIWFHHFFCMFMLGAVVGWTTTGRLSHRWFYGYAGLVACHLLSGFTIELFIAWIAALSIYSCWRIGKLQKWLSAPVLQSLGALSYSLFVIHYPVSWMVGKAGYQLTGDHAWAAVMWLFLSLVASLGAAWLLYNLVERPVLQKTRVLQIPGWLTSRLQRLEQHAISTQHSVLGR